MCNEGVTDESLSGPLEQKQTVYLPNQTSSDGVRKQMYSHTHRDMWSSCGACVYSNSYMFSVTSTAAHRRRAAAAGCTHMTHRRHEGAGDLMGP